MRKGKMMDVTRKFEALALSSFLVLAGCASNPPRFEIGVVGDAPYSAREEAKFAGLVEAVNKVDLAFVVHVGDFQADPRYHQNGSVPCTDQTLASRKALLDTFRHPLIVTPGDNDWSDCHYTKPTTDPLSRLAAVREALFSDDRTLGRRHLQLLRQASQPKFSKFVENARWVYSDVVFVTLHTVGFNNNLGRTSDADAEFSERNEANIAWMNEAFDVAERSAHKAVVIFTQANPYIEDRWPPGYRRIMRMAPTPGEPSGFRALLATLERRAVAFKLPVALIHGDTHFFRVDKPLLREGSYELVENFTRMETFGSPYVHWVRVIVEPGTPGVFTFRPELERGP